MSRSYRTAVLTAPRNFALESRPVLDPGPAQVRVRLEGCGVCGSNLPVWEGRPWFSYPLPPGAPGHEGWGVVDRVGCEVGGFREGERVAILSYNAFAEFDVADASQVVRLPEELEGRPFPGEALGCAMNVFRRADIQPHHRVAILGIGFLGAVLTDLIACAGATVTAISRRTFALDTAIKMGAAHAIPMGSPADQTAEITALINSGGFERVIEATGLQYPLDLASQLTAERGKLIIAGYHQDGLRQVDMQLWNWRGIDVINAHERNPAVYLSGMRAAANAAAAGNLRPDALYTHFYQLDQLPDALNHMGEREGTFMKSLLCYD